MNKEKQIEEMAKDMCEYYYEGTCYQDKKPCDCKCETFTDAQYLYAKGYRKASEVAEEIFAEIEEITMHGITSFGLQTMTMGECAFAELKKKYTESEKDDG